MKFIKIFDRSINHKRMSTLQSVFVYGTLKTGEPNHHWLEATENRHAKLVSKGRTLKKYPLVIASKYNIPFLLHRPGVGEHVIGEVYEVDDQMLSHLDILEDHPSFYIRDVDKIELVSRDSEKKVVDCWIYFLKKFKPGLLSEKFFVEYSSEGNHSKPYTPSDKRVPGHHAKVDVLM